MKQFCPFFTRKSGSQCKKWLFSFQYEKYMDQMGGSRLFFLQRVFTPHIAQSDHRLWFANALNHLPVPFTFTTHSYPSARVPCWTGLKKGWRERNASRAASVKNVVKEDTQSSTFNAPPLTQSFFFYIIYTVVILFYFKDRLMKGTNCFQNLMHCLLKMVSSLFSFSVFNARTNLPNLL